MLAPKWRVAFSFTIGMFLVSFGLPVIGGKEARGSRISFGFLVAAMTTVDLVNQIRGHEGKEILFRATVDDRPYRFAWLIGMSAVANPLFLLCWLTSFFRHRRRSTRGGLGWLIIVIAGIAFSLTLPPLVLFDQFETGFLTIGYYLWSLSIGLLPVTLILGFRPYVGTAATGPAAGGNG